MSDEAATTAGTVTLALPSNAPEKIKTATQSLTSIVPSLSSLDDPTLYAQISDLLRHPDSGAGDNNLCRWLYDTFQSNIPELQLLVLRFLPIIAGVYLSRVSDRKPQAGFEAVLLALYAHETTSRAGQPVSVTLPDIYSQQSIYHESKLTTVKTNTPTDLNLNVTVVSPVLEPHGTVRSTRRARIVGVALELFYSKISEIPVDSKIDFCEFCKIWAGEDGEMYRDFEEGGNMEKMVELDMKKRELGRVPMPWELLQPVLRILGNCLLGMDRKKEKKLFEEASEACRCLFARAMHDVNPKAILPTRSLLRLSKSLASDQHDPTELPKTDVITL